MIYPDSATITEFVRESNAIDRHAYYAAIREYEGRVK